MKIGGLNRCSLVDYPGVIAAVVFTQGCDLRCRYCHNPQLVYPEKFSEIFPMSYIDDFLTDRRGKIDAVVITGGEPLLQYGLEAFMVKVKRMGYLLKLDTNGTHPAVLRRLLSLGVCDYIAMDIKAPLSKYSVVAGVPCAENVIRESIDLIENSNVDFHFRTTYCKDVLTIDDLDEIRSLLSPDSRYFIQDHIPQNLAVR